MNIDPTWQDEIITAIDMEISEEEANQLFELLAVEQPACLKIAEE